MVSCLKSLIPVVRWTPFPFLPLHQVWEVVHLTTGIKDFKQDTMTEGATEGIIIMRGVSRVDTQIAITTTITLITTITTRTIRTGTRGTTGMITETGTGIGTETGGTETRMITRNLASFGWNGASAGMGTDVFIHIPVDKGDAWGT